MVPAQIAISGSRINGKSVTRIVSIDLVRSRNRIPKNEMMWLEVLGADDDMRDKRPQEADLAGLEWSIADVMQPY